MPLAHPRQLLIFYDLRPSFFRNGSWMTRFSSLYRIFLGRIFSQICARAPHSGMYFEFGDGKWAWVVVRLQQAIIYSSLVQLHVLFRIVMTFDQSQFSNAVVGSGSVAWLRSERLRRRLLERQLTKHAKYARERIALISLITTSMILIGGRCLYFRRCFHWFWTLFQGP